MSDIPHRYALAARWTNDAQGKKDYDGDILSISTRYWPRGGGFLAVIRTPQQVTFIDDAQRPEVKPSAKSSLMLQHTDEDGYTDIISQEFEGETFDDVAAQVETWAQTIMDRVVQALQAEFGSRKEPLP